MQHLTQETQIQEHVFSHESIRSISTFTHTSSLTLLSKNLLLNRMNLCSTVRELEGRLAAAWVITRRQQHSLDAEI